MVSLKPIHWVCIQGMVSYQILPQRIVIIHLLHCDVCYLSFDDIGIAHI